MPYCYKCGVEVRNGQKKCPLCSYPLPIIKEEAITKDRYPSQKNVYNKIAERKKNIFFAVYVSLAFSLSIMLILLDLENQSLSWSIYVTICLISGIIYFFPFLGYIKSWYANIIIWGINTAFLCYLTDLVNGEVTWFFKLALPIISTIVLFLMVSIFSCRKKIYFTYKLISVLIYLSILLILLEIYIDLVNKQTINLLWSIQSTILFLPIILIIIFIPKNRYESIREYFKRKFHV
ncbi:MAG: DUF6320 domain-containing protein [Lachnospirales bacterium]